MTFNESHDPTEVTSAVLTVGAPRGFVIDGPNQSLVIAAAHCLQHLPPCSPTSSTSERTYKDLLAPIGGHPSIWAECLFVDPVGADV
jgi:hypothetical protein